MSWVEGGKMREAGGKVCVPKDYWMLMQEKGVKSVSGLKPRSRQNTEIGWQMK